MKQSFRKAFSLVDIMVYMAILSVLIGLAFAGINIAQRSGRDQERKVLVEQMRAESDLFYRSSSAYPVEGTTLIWTTSSLQIGTKSIELSGFKQYSSSKTDYSQTRYTYQKDRTGYIFCVKMESGDWYRTGNGGDTLKCPTN